MTSVFRKLPILTQHSLVLKQTASLLCRTTSIQLPVWVQERSFKSMPTKGIGRWRHLVAKEQPKKKRANKHQMKPILEATDTAYGTLNVNVWGYDMTMVERFSEYIHNLCNRLGVKVADSYALPTKTTEVMLMPEHGNKMFVDAVLKTHTRVVQLSSLEVALCQTFVDVILKNQPEGVQFSIEEHTEADYKARFKLRPDLEELVAQVHQY